MEVKRPIRIILLGLLLLGSGCKNKHLLEAELRSREIQFRELLDDYERTQQHNHAIEHELSAIRQGWPIPPEMAAHTFTVQKIALGKLTGGTDIDGCYGDDGLMVVVEPRDCQDETLKAPGSLHVLAMEINSQGIKTPIGAWDVAPDQLHRSWRKGLMGNGYTVTLPFQALPSTENVRVTARFVMPDGRVFEADKDVKVRLATRHQPPGMPPGGVMPSPGPMVAPPADSPLFMPRPAPEAAPQAAPPGGEPSTSLRPAIEVKRPVPLPQR